MGGNDAYTTPGRPATLYMEVSWIKPIADVAVLRVRATDTHQTLILVPERPYEAIDLEEYEYKYQLDHCLEQQNGASYSTSSS